MANYSVAPLGLRRLAVMVALVAPAKRPEASQSCYVPWWLVEDIRKACEAEGIDWKQMQRNMGRGSING